MISKDVYEVCVVLIVGDALVVHCDTHWYEKNSTSLDWLPILIVCNRDISIQYYLNLLLVSLVTTCEFSRPAITALVLFAYQTGACLTVFRNWGLKVLSWLVSPFLYHADLSKACGSFLLNELSVSRHGHFASGDWREESDFPIHAFGVHSFEGNCSKLLLAWSKQAPANYVSARQNTPSDEGKILLLKSQRLQKSGCSRGHQRATTMKLFVRTKRKNNK